MKLDEPVISNRSFAIFLSWPTLPVAAAWEPAVWNAVQLEKQAAHKICWSDCGYHNGSYCSFSNAYLREDHEFSTCLETENPFKHSTTTYMISKISIYILKTDHTWSNTCFQRDMDQPHRRHWSSLILLANSGPPCCKWHLLGLLKVLETISPNEKTTLIGLTKTSTKLGSKVSTKTTSNDLRNAMVGSKQISTSREFTKNKHNKPILPILLTWLSCSFGMGEFHLRGLMATNCSALLIGLGSPLKQLAAPQATPLLA